MSYRLPVKRISKLIFFTGLIGVLWACSNDKKPNIPNVELSQELSQKYQASCQTCHETKGTGAPQKGHSEAWDKILSDPFTEVMQKVVDGSNGMPPLGQCFDCTAQDLETLIYYLAQPADAN